MKIVYKALIVHEDEKLSFASGNAYNVLDAVENVLHVLPDAKITIEVEAEREDEK